MKKRVILSTIASLTLAGVMCVGLAACGDKGDYGDAKAAKNITGEKVTKEVWDAAISCVNDTETFYNAYDNFEVVFTNEEISKDEYSTGLVTTTHSLINTYSTEKFDTHIVSKSKTTTDGKLPKELQLAGKTSKESSESEYYVSAAVGGTPFVIEKTKDGWRSVNITSSNSGSYNSGRTMLYGLIKSTIVKLDLEFADYDYSEEHGGYVEKNSQSTDMLVVVKFQDGKLKAIYSEYNYESSFDGHSTQTTSSYIISYGGQSVTMPEV